MTIGRGAALAAAVLFCLAGPLRAAEVTLAARAGGLSFTGELLGFDGVFYRIETEFGEVTLDRAQVACTGAACPDPDAFVARVTVSGGDEIGRALMPPLVETFARRAGYRLVRSDPDGRSIRYSLLEAGTDSVAGEFTFLFGTSAEGFADLIADEADLALSLREISRVEATLAREAGRGRLTAAGRSRIVGLDALVPVVSVANPLESISLSDLAGIVRGEIGAWSEVAGAAIEGPIALHLLAPETGLGQALERRLLVRPNAVAPDAVLHATPEALAKAVDADPRALGITAFSAVGNAQPVTLRGPCGAVAEATIPAIKTEDYPLTAPVFLYAPARRLPDLVRDFVDYATSPAAQGIVRRAGLVDQFPIRIPLAQQGERLVTAILGAGDGTALADLRRMATALTGKSRLSISFRFEGGSAELDAQSRSNAILLARAVSRGVFDGRTLSFVGFSDGQGAAATNRRLSLRRAEVVRRAIARSLDDRTLGDVAFETRAFGEALPMACDETAWGRRVNRRVEVWLD